MIPARCFTKTATAATPNLGVEKQCRPHLLKAILDCICRGKSLLRLPRPVLYFLVYHWVTIQGYSNEDSLYRRFIGDIMAG
jgi:hypothetical protein